MRLIDEMLKLVVMELLSIKKIFLYLRMVHIQVKY